MQWRIGLCSRVEEQNFGCDSSDISGFPLPCLRREATYTRMIRHQSTFLVWSGHVRAQDTDTDRPWGCSGAARDRPSWRAGTRWQKGADHCTTLTWWHCSWSPEHRGAHGALLIRLCFPSTANSQATSWAQKGVKAAPGQHGKSDIIFLKVPRKRMASPQSLVHSSQTW